VTITIDPIVAGMLIMLGIQIAAFIVLGVVSAVKKRKKGKADER
jgi:hypothetical protein